MAQMENSDAGNSKRKIRPGILIDMTPMVDLAFLLITFFIFTTSMTEKRAMRLIMPVDTTDSASAPQSKVLTVLLDSKNKVFAYEGMFEEAINNNQLISTTYSQSDGIGKLIRDKQKRLEKTDRKEGKDALIFLIKPTKQASYKNIIDALDETTINNVKNS